MKRHRGIAVLLGLGGAYALWVRPRLLRWGATPDEVLEPFPGSNIVPEGRRGATMAITIDAPASEVWPWLLQMGCGRAGWYSWDRLDNAGSASACRLHPEWQAVSVGQKIDSTPSGDHWFEVAALEPERFFALRAAFTQRGRQYDATGPRPRSFLDTLWAFQLKTMPGGQTRLVVSGYTAGRPRLITWLSGLLFWEPVHCLMQKRQLTNIKRRAEALGRVGSRAC
jgi:hypothetical protein